MIDTLVVIEKFSKIHQMRLQLFCATHIVVQLKISKPSRLYLIIFLKKKLMNKFYKTHFPN